MALSTRTLTKMRFDGHPDHAPKYKPPGVCPWCDIHRLADHVEIARDALAAAADLRTVVPKAFNSGRPESAKVAKFDAAIEEWRKAR